MAKKSVNLAFVQQYNLSLIPLKGRCDQDVFREFEKIAHPCIGIPLPEAEYQHLLKAKSDYFQQGNGDVLVLVSHGQQYALLPLTRSAALNVLSQQ